MNYFDYTRQFWDMAQIIDFSHFETALYFYFLDQLNRSRWQESISINSGVLREFFNVHRNTLHNALQTINENTSLKIEQKNGSKFIKVIQKPCIEKVQVDVCNVQVSDHEPTIEKVQVDNWTIKPALKPAQAPAIENVQVDKNFDSLHYNIENKEKDFLYIDKKNKKNINKNLRGKLKGNLRGFLQDAANN